MCHSRYQLEYSATSGASFAMEEKEKGYVPQPHILNTYSENIGGVDKHDWLVSKYPISIRGKNDTGLYSLE